MIYKAVQLMSYRASPQTLILESASLDLEAAAANNSMVIEKYIK